MLEEVRRIGAVILDAWRTHDLEPCRPVLSDDAWIAQTAQLARPLAEGWRPYAGAVTLHADRILSLQSQQAGDRVTVRVRLVSNAGAGKVIRGRRISEWVEDWTVVRTRLRPFAAPAGFGGPSRRPSDPIPSSPWLLDSMAHVAVHLERAA